METNNRDMIETLLEASLSENYSNTKEFMYEMAKRYRRVDQGINSATLSINIIPISQLPKICMSNVATPLEYVV